MKHISRVSKPKKKPRKNKDFFTNLPSEIIIDILSRLPVRTIISCKCVCKPWLNLLGTEEFAKSHLSKSVSGLAIKYGKACNIFEFDDVLNLVHHDHHYIPVTRFDSPRHEGILGSANGLLFVEDLSTFEAECDYYIINPITREHMLIPDPCKSVCEVVIFGFGASRITGQLKVVRKFHDCSCAEQTCDWWFPASACQVYTLGTGLWRSINPGPILEYNSFSYGVFLNGNLYWLSFDLNGCPLISCFDLEDELFSIFPTPPDPLAHSPAHSRRHLHLCALEDCLCLSDNVSNDEFVLWLMKDYGVEKSWTKDYVISKSLNLDKTAYHHLVYPIKVFKDGDILIAWGGLCFFYYSTETKTTHMINIFQSSWDLIRHASSFISLKRFEKEKMKLGILEIHAKGLERNVVTYNAWLFL